MTTKEICQYIEELKVIAKERGEKELVLVSGNVHKDLGLKNRMPQVCNAMYQCMRSGDKIVHTTPSGYSSTIEIEYKFIWLKISSVGLYKNATWCVWKIR